MPQGHASPKRRDDGKRSHDKAEYGSVVVDIEMVLGTSRKKALVFYRMPEGVFVDEEVVKVMHVQSHRDEDHEYP